MPAIKSTQRTLTGLQRTAIASLLSLCCLPAAGGQFTDPLDGKFDASQYLAENAYGFLPVPIILTEPALGGFGLGMIGLFFHESEEEQEARRRAAMSDDDEAVRRLMTPSLSALFGMYTANDSWMAGGFHMRIMKQDNIRYMAGLGHGSFNMDFYSAGPIEFPRALELEIDATFLFQEIKFRIAGSRFMAGFQQMLSDSNIGLPTFDLPNFPGLEDLINNIGDINSTLSGLGVVAEWDNRDNMFDPRKGYNYKLTHLWHDDAIGSDVDYTKTSLSGLNFWEFGDAFVGGLRLAGEWVESDGDIIPIHVKPFIQMRGIPAMRYQGQYVALAEAQLTWRANLRWSLLGFAGAGRTGEAFDELNDGPSYTTRGAGFRYLIARRYSMNMGVDIARGPEETAYYITAGSAW